MTLKVRRLLRISRQLDQALKDGSQEAIERVWRKGEDVRNMFVSLKDKDWSKSETMAYIHHLTRETIREENQNRLAQWKDKMEWCERDAINWIKQDEDELQGEGVEVGVDWQQNAEKLERT